MTYAGARTGNRRIFAIEYEFAPPIDISPGDVWGCLWLWADGRCIGQSWEVELVDFGLNALREAADDRQSRVSPLLSSMPAEEALDLVVWARYGDDDPKLESMVGSRQSLEQFEILPRRTGPFFDGWQAILIDEGMTEKFAFRTFGGETHEATWANGVFRRTAYEACEAFAESLGKR